MKMFFAILAGCLLVAQPPTPKGRTPLPTIEPTADERARLQAKVKELDDAVSALQQKRIDESLIADVAVFAKAGRWLLEFPGGFFEQSDILNAFSVLDQGLDRARLLKSGSSPWVAQKGRKIHGYYSPLDGSVQPYGLSVPESYDGSRPVRLYVWLHGRNAKLTESSFITTFPKPPNPTSTAAAEDVGQILLDVYGRGNNANHWAGEVDIFEAIAAVQKRYKIDPDRIILRGFSLGGAGAWHVALHHPDAFAAAEIGAGTWPRRSLMASSFPPYQAATLRIWENIMEWALNAFNLPIAGHDGDNDTQVASIPPPPRDQKTRGQLESSIRVREQLAKEGFPSEGQPHALAAKGTPAIFLISENTGHGVSPAVRKRLNLFLKEWGDKGRVSPDHIRFLTYTTRYNRSYWVSLDGLEKHYERAEVDAQRSEGGRRVEVTTKNLSRLTLREMNKAETLRIDGQEVRVKPAASVTVEKSGGRWKTTGAKWSGLHKTHALQGPIDDAFLDPYLLVRPTGTPWNAAAHQQALKTLERFDRAYARNYRAHPRIKDDKDVTEADFRQYHVVLFGDPGSNRWIAKVAGKLPIRWTREAIVVGKQSYAAAEHLPALIYPNPLNSARYVVINSGLTIDEREYNSDYSMPRLGDIAIWKLKPDGAEVAWADLFDEEWRLAAR